LFAVPNGGNRNMLEALKMKREGIYPGISDLILLVSRKDCNTLCIEMKTERGKQSAEQKSWQEYAEKHGNKYIICRTLEQFIFEINNYLQR